MVTSCLGGGSGGLTAGVILAPLLVARGLGRRAAHWLVLHNQRRLQKLSLRRNRRKAERERGLRSWSQPLVGEQTPVLLRQRPHSCLPRIHCSIYHSDRLITTCAASGDRVGVGAPTESPPPLPDQPPSLGPSTKGPVPVAAVPPVIVPTAKKSLPALPSNPVDDAPQCLAPPPPSGTNGSISAMPVLVMGDGDTIEMTPLYLQIKDRSYFHPITRKESKSILENVPDGTFLMRPSKRQSNNPLTLCLRYNGKTYNINVRERPDKTFALGMEKPNESTFKSVDEIVSVHKIDYIKLEDGRKVQLLSSPPKYSNILD